MKKIILILIFIATATVAFPQSVDSANIIISSVKTESMKQALREAVLKFLSLENQYGERLEVVDIIDLEGVEAKFGPGIFTKRFTQNLTFMKKCFLRKKKIDSKKTIYNYLTFCYPNEGIRVQASNIPKEVFRPDEARFVIAKSRRDVYIIYFPKE